MSPAEQAQSDVKAQDRRRALKTVSDLQGRQQRAKASAVKARNKFEDAVAKTVSSKASDRTWWAHPGPLKTEDVMQAAKLKPIDLDRLMARYARRHIKRNGRSPS